MGGLLTSLGPGNSVGLLRIDADDSEHGQVNAVVVAAGLLARGAGVLLAVGAGHGPVHDPGRDPAESGLRCLSSVLESRINEPSADKIVTSERITANFISGNAATLLTTGASGNSSGGHLLLRLLYQRSVGGAGAGGNTSSAGSLRSCRVQPKLGGEKSQSCINSIPTFPVFFLLISAATKYKLGSRQTLVGSNR